MTVIARAIRDKWASALSRIRVCYHRLMGTQIGDNCYIGSGAHIDIRKGKVIVGNKVEIASGSYILAHARTAGQRGASD